MPLQLIISENRPELLAIWSRVFQDVEGVSLLNADIRTLMGLPNVDALVMPSMLAHARYGSSPQIGESQVLSTKGEQGMPPLIVTTAPFAAHFESSPLADGTVKTVLVQDEKLTPEEEVYILFSKIFDCVKLFNKNNERKIQKLGVDLSFLNFPLGETAKEAEAVRRAYFEQFGDDKN